jgi:hypothetical protein
MGGFLIIALTQPRRFVYAEMKLEPGEKAAGPIRPYHKSAERFCTPFPQ